MNEDPRKTALERGLAQCDTLQLITLISHIESGGELLLDRGPHGEDCAVVATIETSPPQFIATYSPLAVAASWRGESRISRFAAIDPRWHNDVVRESLLQMHPTPWEPNTTRGVAGEYFRDNRRGDLLASARAVLAAKDAK